MAVAAERVWRLHRRQPLPSLTSAGCLSAIAAQRKTIAAHVLVLRVQQLNPYGAHGLAVSGALCRHEPSPRHLHSLQHRAALPTVVVLSLQEAPQTVAEARRQLGLPLCHHLFDNTSQNNTKSSAGFCWEGQLHPRSR